MKGIAQMELATLKSAKVLLCLSLCLNVVLGVVYFSRSPDGQSGSGDGTVVAETEKSAPRAISIRPGNRELSAIGEAGPKKEERPRLPLSVIAHQVGRVVSGDGKRLSPAVVDIFKISEPEQSAVLERVGAIMDRIQAAELAAIKLTKTDDGEQYLVLEPDDKLKAGVERELETALTQVLGESRGSRVAGLAAAQNILGLESTPLNLYLEGSPGSYVFVVERPGAPKDNYDQIPERFAHLLDKAGWDKLLKESWKDPFEN